MRPTKRLIAAGHCTDTVQVTLAASPTPDRGDGSSRPWRTMSDGAGHVLQYNIYQPDGTTIWDETNPKQGTVNGGVGTGSTTPSQMRAHIAKVNPAQTTPPASTYTETVNVIISF